MRNILHQSNLDLLRQIGRLETALSSTSVLPELSAYHGWIQKACTRLRAQAYQNLQYLNLGEDRILPDVLSETQRLAREFRLYNERLAGPILRSLPSDRLCLRVISWLHGNHPETQSIPAGLSNGIFGVWPVPYFPIVYFMPASRQLGLLYLPILFHEFGHLLYACHKPEMNDLVRELQEEITDLLIPLAQRNDLQDREQVRGRRIIVERWYEWSQELFCDAVGFTIGGPSFAHAFSMYFRTGGPSEFHIPREDLELRSHPVTWLRVRLLADRIRRAGLLKEANSLEAQWDNIACTVGARENYHGFYGTEFLPIVRQTLDNMLIEVSPYYYTEADISSSEWDPCLYLPIHLLNVAWDKFLSDSNDYDKWENQAILTLLTDE